MKTAKYPKCSMQNLSLQYLDDFCWRQSSETVWTYYKEEKYSWPPKNKCSHMHGMYTEWLACAIVHLSHAVMGPSYVCAHF